MTHENQEPSYYEIALTNRQVLMAFIVILTSVLGAFLCGVWVGRGGSSDPLHAEELQVAENSDPEAGQDEDLEKFRFFTDEDQKKGRVKKPDLSPLKDEPKKEEPKKDTTLAQDVKAKPNPPAQRPKRETQGRAAKAETAPPPPPRPAPPPPKPAPPPPPPASKPEPAPPTTASAASTASAAGQFIVQVFSTHDEVQARKVLGQVEAEGYPAFIAPLDQPEGKFYRVRIGPFDEKTRAERAARGVKKKFKLDTWVTAASN